MRQLPSFQAYNYLQPWFYKGKQRNIFNTSNPKEKTPSWWICQGAELRKHPLRRVLTTTSFRSSGKNHTKSHGLPGFTGFTWSSTCVHLKGPCCSTKTWEEEILPGPSAEGKDRQSQCSVPARHDSGLAPNLQWRPGTRTSCAENIQGRREKKTQKSNEKKISHIMPSCPLLNQHDNGKFMENSGICIGCLDVLPAEHDWCRVAYCSAIQHTSSVNFNN